MLNLVSENNRGFTLVEIAVSVAILGVALTTLISLQTSHVNTYMNERDRTKASLYAQYLMTMIEIKDLTETLGSESKSLRTALDDVGFFDDDEFGSASKRELDEWKYELYAEDFQLEGVPFPVPLKQIRITISWGESNLQTYALEYFKIVSMEENA